MYRWDVETLYETFGVKRVYVKQITTAKNDYSADISRFSPFVRLELRGWISESTFLTFHVILSYS